MAATRIAPASSSSQWASGLPEPNGAGRVEAIEHTVPVEEEQPVLRPPSRREEEQLQLIRGQDAVPVEVERDLPVALGLMPREPEQPLRAHAERLANSDLKVETACLRERAVA